MVRVTIRFKQHSPTSTEVLSIINMHQEVLPDGIQKSNGDTYDFGPEELRRRMVEAGWSVEVETSSMFVFGKAS